ncbi:DUF2207 family protein [Nocardia camponoti]|uniref:Predicted membrane protein YciQ-like C-terminal domain-containing protein n=1 Tax=Nocardia camponoti TaxID=1616106 RepID=A0A917QNZ4_9NOCA|nr:DUF2207 domain-containing protein [Nocardia camponoti]GGK61188.1 hypothetical protein GCM10011591_36910 [Nocardia camponoti]
MLTFRGAALGALLLASGCVLAGAPVATADPGAGVSIVADLTLTTDGVLRVVETVDVPADGTFKMSLPLRLKVADDVERTFRVTDVTATGSGSAVTANDQFVVSATPGEAKFAYTIHNTVADMPGAQTFHWLGALNADIAALDVSVISPSFQMGIVDCKLGPAGSAKPCADIRVEPDGTLYLTQRDLHKGDAIDLTLQMPPGTVAANADIRDGNAPGPFSFTAPVFAAFGAVLLAVLSMVAYVLFARKRTAAALVGNEEFNPLASNGDRVELVSPDGLLPGEAGLLLDGYVDPVDIAATVVDLAVRRYLLITPINARGEDDWRISRVNAPDDQLREYERAVYDMLLPAGTDTVAVRELRAPNRFQLKPLREAIRADAIENGTFADPKQRRIPQLIGGALIGIGLVLAVVLALTVGHALIGVAIALGGVAATLLPKYLPTRTPLGDELARKMRAMGRGLESVTRQQVPPIDQETLFSRGLPYTVVTGRVDNWIRTFRDMDPSADAQPGLYWFAGYHRDRDLHRFASQFPFFITALQAAC